MAEQGRVYMTPAPDQARAREQYRGAARGYDQHMRPFRRWQREAIDRLELKEGETVLDVACGTGINFEALEAKLGGTGRIIGIDLSPDMLRQAHQRVRNRGWANASLIEAAVEDADVDVSADAALFSFTHDVLQSEQAVANVVAHLRLGARVASTGAKLGRNPLVNWFVRRAARDYITTFEGLDRPWRPLEKYAEMTWRPRALGGAYVAWGTVVRSPNA
jgi:ubiquinone/menaquinone biosynthesis C-methylase UbiE